MEQSKFFGILMPISSLPSPYGVGTIGKGAYQFVDFLKKSGGSVWQLLPLNVTSYGDSPYQSPSSKGLNYYFIDIEDLIEKGLLKKSEVADFYFGDNPGRVDYKALFDNRISLLKMAFCRYDRSKKAFKDFVKKGEYNDFAFFMTLKELHGYRPWYEWDYERNYTPELEEWTKKAHKNLYLFYVWTQFIFLEQYTRLKKYANKKGIRIMGDMPIYVAYDSVEAYKYPHLFKFDEKHNPTKVAGVPPDAFSDDGQLWGNPIYDWDNQKKDGYAWFNERIKSNLEIFDILRIDHFRGFSAYYEIPFGHTTAREGQWVDGPSFDLFKDKTNLSIVAENLGVIDQGVIDLMDKTGYPGMNIVLFGINNDYDKDTNKPQNATFNNICYTGTHDNETVKGTLLGFSKEDYEACRRRVKEACEITGTPFKAGTLNAFVGTIDRLCIDFPTLGAILPMHDILRLDNSARLNRPSVISADNWVKRFKKSDFKDSIAKELKSWAKEAGRC